MLLMQTAETLLSVLGINEPSALRAACNTQAHLVYTDTRQAISHALTLQFH